MSMWFSTAQDGTKRAARSWFDDVEMMLRMVMLRRMRMRMRMRMIMRKMEWKMIRWRMMMLRKMRWRMMMLRMMMLRGRKMMMLRVMMLKRRTIFRMMMWRRRRTDRSQERDNRFVREPAQLKSTWTFHESHSVQELTDIFLRNLTGKMPEPEVALVKCPSAFRRRRLVQSVAPRSWASSCPTSSSTSSSSISSSATLSSHHHHHHHHQHYYHTLSSHPPVWGLLPR